MNEPFVTNRHSVRVRGYNYANPGFYFVTICTQNMHKCLSEVVDGQIQLSEFGVIVKYWWDRIENKFPNVKCREMAIMPNHFHCVIELVGADPCVRPPEDPCVRPSEDQMGGHMGPPLHEVVQWFKTMSTNNIIRHIKERGYQRFDKRFWQRSYYEHVIQTADRHQQIVDYIEHNPMQWAQDRYNI